MGGNGFSHHATLWGVWGQVYHSNMYHFCIKCLIQPTVSQVEYVWPRLVTYVVVFCTYIIRNVSATTFTFKKVT